MVASSYEYLRERLKSSPKRWLVTGAAGFIGSHLVENLLTLGQTVVGLDNFSTGKHENIELVRESVGSGAWSSFRLIQGDITHLEACKGALEGVSHVLHQAALGSVPRSIENPIATNEANINGFLNMLVASRDAGVESFTYAASSSTYGDHTALPKVEDTIGNPLSPYAITKYVNELYARIFAQTYGFKTIGLRYFNVFGPRQDPNGAYAAVVPRWLSAITDGADVNINGDGETSRDFCYIQNVVQANILAAMSNDSCRDEVYNVAVGGRTSLNDLYHLLETELRRYGVTTDNAPHYRDFRQGDVRHSEADISKVKAHLGYEPSHNIRQGIEALVAYHVSTLADSSLNEDVEAKTLSINERA